MIRRLSLVTLLVLAIVPWLAFAQGETPVRIRDGVQTGEANVTGGRLEVDGSGVTQPVSGTVTSNQGSPPWSVSGTVTCDAGTGTFLVGDGTGPLTVDGTVAATQSGAWTTTCNAGTGTFTVGGTVTANAGTGTFFDGIIKDGTGDTTQANVTSGRLNVDGSGVTQPVSGTVTANAGSGTFTVSGTVTANAGTNLNTSALALDATVGRAQASTTSGQTGPLVQGAVTTAAPTYTTGQTDPLSLTTAGSLRVDGSGSTQPVSGTVTANAGTGTFATNTAQVNAVTVDVGIGAAGTGTQRVAVANNSKVQVWDGTNTASVNASSQLAVNCANCTGSGVSQQDKTAFTAGSSNMVPIGGYLDDVSPSTLAEGEAGAARLTANRAVHANLRDASGNEISTSTPLNVQIGNGTNQAQVTATSGGSLQIECTGGCGGGTQYAEDTASADAEQLTMAGAVRQDTPASSTTLDGDRSNIKVDSVGRLWVNGSGVTQPVSGTVTANAGSGTFTVAGTVTANAGTGTFFDGIIRDGTGDTTQANVTSGRLNVDGSGVTQPVSGTVTANAGSGTFTVSGTVTANAGTGDFLSVTGHTRNEAFKEANATGGELDDTATVAATEGNVSPVRITAQRAYHVNLRNNAGTELGTSGAPVRTDPTGTTTQPVSGTVTANAGTGTFAVSGTVTANAGTNLNTSALALDATVGRAQGSTTSGQTGPLVQGAVTTAAPTYTTAQTNPLSLTTAGALRVDGSAVTQPVSGTVAVSGTTSVNQTQIGSVAITVGNGVSGTGVQRVTIASDSTGQVAISGTAAVNQTQVGGTAISTGNGASGAGVQRVTIANDSTGVVGVVPLTSGGTSLSRTVSAASTNATNVKASAGQVYSLQVANTTATALFVHLYNGSGTPTCNTAIIATYIVPGASAGAGTNIKLQGAAFGTGIGFCITTAADGTGSVGAGDAILMLEYK